MRAGLALSQSDERLVRRAKRGDRRAFEQIFERYNEDLYRFCLMQVGSRHDAEDALQSTMVKVLRALPGERREIQLRPWIYAIARNEAIDTVRRRREGADVEPEELSSGTSLVSTVEARERLGRLIEDLRELPERQRAAVVMRELGDFGYGEIGDVLQTSADAARQAVYEARVSLRQMEAGREMKCDLVIHELSEADGRVTRRREVQAHLRACSDCRAFRDSITRRRGEMRAIAPLPLAASAALLQGALGAGAGTGGLAAGAGAGQAVLGSTVAKIAATCVVVAAVGTTAADRGGLIDVPVGDGDAREGVESGPADRHSRSIDASPAALTRGPVRAAAHSPASGADRARGARAVAGGDGVAGSPGADAPGAAESAPGSPSVGATGKGAPNSRKNAAGHGQGRAPGLPPASSHGQQTASAHKSPNANADPGVSRGAAKGPSESTSPPPSGEHPAPQGAPATDGPAAEPPAHGKSGESQANGAGRSVEEVESTE